MVVELLCLRLEFKLNPKVKFSFVKKQTKKLTVP